MKEKGLLIKNLVNLVNKKTCTDIVKKLNIKKYHLGSSHKNLERTVDKIIWDSLEAIVGAIYLDGGLKLVEKFILNCWDTYIDKSIVTHIDSKTKLQEFSLKDLKTSKIYFFKKTGPQHKPLFKTEVEIQFQKVSGIYPLKKVSKMLLKN